VVDFLQRMSTNDMRGFESGEVRATVLTTAIGRTVDAVLALRQPAEVLLLTTPGRAATVRQWLGRYIFFNDDVRLDLPEGESSLWGFYGPSAVPTLAELAGRDAAPSGMAFAAVDDGLVWQAPESLPGLRLLAGRGLHNQARRLWGECGPGTANAGAFEALRVERGVASGEADLGEDVIPLEVGLWDQVSFSKGCYIGQEIIARMESRQRLARQLAGLRLERGAPVPQDIQQDGQSIGQMTSFATSPRLGPIGLGLVRVAALDTAPGAIRLEPSGVAGTLQHLPLDAAG
jgi:aminomethyltransferase